MLRTSSRLGLVAAAIAGVIAGALSGGPVHAAIEAVMSCSGSAPCLQWTNTGGGNAVKGISAGGNALLGQTKYKSTGQSAGKAGVLGQDVSTSGTLDAGVLGTSTNGTGVMGTSTSLNGIAGFSTGAGASGVYGQNSSTGFGVAGRNTATSHDNGAAGVLADGGTVNDGLHAFGNGPSANGMYAFSQSGSAIVANQGPNTTATELLLQDTSSSNNMIIDAVGPSGDVFDVKPTGFVDVPQTLDVGTVYATGPMHVQTTSGTPGNFQVSCCNEGVALIAGDNGVPTGQNIFEVTSQGSLRMYANDQGNLTVTGLLYSNGNCNSGCIVGGKQVRAVSEYAPTETEPTVEDSGEAQLVSGVADVALDPKFANVIDPRAAYLVTVTPEADCEGLFVAMRSQNGFVVRELRHGRSDVPFAYRIVAKRFGVQASRLPMVDIRPASPERRHHG